MFYLSDSQTTETEIVPITKNGLRSFETGGKGKVEQIGSSHGHRDNGGASNNHSPSYSIVSVFLVVTVGVSFILGYMVAGHSLVSTSKLSDSSTTQEVSAQDPFYPDIIVYNDYTKETPVTSEYNLNYKSEIYYIEPERPTTFEVVNSDNRFKYSWDFDYGVVVCENSPTCVLSVAGELSKKQGKLYVKLVAEHTKSGTKTVSLHAVKVRYVRRELRRLLEQDRVAFFQAVAILQRVPTQVGKKLFGDNYRSRDFFNRMHLYFGGSKSCDHWHQGAGFTVTHFALSHMYELALQSINPSIALPYWDFTLESTFYTPETFRDSIVFSQGWFSTAQPANAMSTPDTGRFAYVPIMKNAQNFSKIYNPYGLLRSPWNADPNPYLTRSSKIYSLANNLKPSGCNEYYRASVNREWKSLSISLNSYAHGHIHELMGGSWGARSQQLTFKNMSNVDGVESVYEFAHLTEALLKVLWRAGYLKCAENDEWCMSPEAVDSVHFDKASFRCSCKLDWSQLNESFTIIDMLDVTGIGPELEYVDNKGNSISQFTSKDGKLLSALTGYTEEETMRIYQEIVDLLSDVGYIGDMFQVCMYTHCRVVVWS